MATLIKNLPQQVDYEVWRGDDWAPGTITADVSGTVINFTGWQATMEIRNIISGAVAITLSSPSSGITLSSAGVITITMTAAQTNTLMGQYKYDLQMKSPTNTIKTYLYGTISVYPDNTANT